uniref:Tick transposon n=1 Tax=Rhipicephalus zambeziensis TaxID=60191 RepID=A0A224Z1B3_9ACAR
MSRSNTAADDAVKNAHENGEMEPIPLSRSDAAAKINMLARDVARSMWNTPGFLHTRLHSLDPCLRLAIPSGLPRPETTVLYRMWLGVSFTNAFAAASDGQTVLHVNIAALMKPLHMCYISAFSTPLRDSPSQQCLRDSTTTRFLRSQS